MNHCSGLSNVMFGESGITMEKTSDFSAADASVIVNLELTKLTTKDLNFFSYCLGLITLKHYGITAEKQQTPLANSVFLSYLQARGEVLELDHVSSQFLFPLVGQCIAGHVSECS